MELERKQLFGIISIFAVLFGLLGVPLLVQTFTDINAIDVLFPVVVIYILLHFALKRYDVFSLFD